MIRSIDIRNFQSHRNTHIELSPGVNVIVGVSDSGKTAVLRALDWLINNRPTGEAFRSKWGGDTSVAITLDDGTVVERIRTKSLNCYRIGELTLEAMKTEVPQEVQALLNIHDINIQRQHDRPFLLSDNSGDVAKYLNNVANLEKIDRSLENVSRMERNNAQELKGENSRLEQLEETARKYEYLEDAEKDVTKLEQLEKELELAEGKILKIHSLTTEITSISATHKRIQNLLQSEQELANLGEVLSLKKELEIKKDRLIKIGSQINSLKKDIAKFPDCLEDGLRDIQNIQDVYEEWQKLKNKDNSVNILWLEINRQEDRIVRMTENISRAEKEFREIMPDICPLCNTNLKGKVR